MTAEFNRRRKMLADFLKTVPDTHYCHDTYGVVFPDGWLEENYGRVLDYLEDTDDAFGNAVATLCDDRESGVMTPYELLHYSSTVCGTAACASGWAAVGVREGLLDIPDYLIGDERCLAEWLGYSGNRSDSPFWGNAYGKDLGAVTKADVIAYLEKGIDR